MIRLEDGFGWLYRNLGPILYRALGLSNRCLGLACLHTIMRWNLICLQLVVHDLEVLLHLKFDLLVLRGIYVQEVALVIGDAALLGDGEYPALGVSTQDPDLHLCFLQHLYNPRCLLP